MEFRKVDMDNEDELRFIAEMDTRIPLEYDQEARVWNEKSVFDKLGQYKKEITEDDFFEVVTDENKIIGFHVVKKVPYPPDLFSGMIFTLWVAPEYRRRGIAKKLKARAEDWAKKQGISYLRTSVHANNIKMLEINKNSGFELIQYSLRKKI